MPGSGYKKNKKGIFQHPTRKVFFVGDLPRNRSLYAGGRDGIGCHGQPLIQCFMLSYQQCPRQPATSFFS